MPEALSPTLPLQAGSHPTSPEDLKMGNVHKQHKHELERMWHQQQHSMQKCELRRTEDHNQGHPGPTWLYTHLAGAHSSCPGLAEAR